jgi:hypothetical protein
LSNLLISIMLFSCIIIYKKLISARQNRIRSDTAWIQSSVTNTPSIPKVLQIDVPAPLTKSACRRFLTQKMILKFVAWFASPRLHVESPKKKHICSISRILANPQRQRPPSRVS